MSANNNSNSSSSSSSDNDSSSAIDSNISNTMSNSSSDESDTSMTTPAAFRSRRRAAVGSPAAVQSPATAARSPVTARVLLSPAYEARMRTAFATIVGGATRSPAASARSPRTPSARLPAAAACAALRAARYPTPSARTPADEGAARLRAHIAARAALQAARQQSPAATRSPATTARIATARAALGATSARSPAAASPAPKLAPPPCLVPAGVGSWMVQILQSPQPYHARKIDRNGLAVLKLDELKRIWQHGLAPLWGEIVEAKIRALGTPKGNKAVYAARVRRYFYTDDACTVPNEALLGVVRAQTVAAPAVAAAQPAAAAAAVAAATSTIEEYLAQMTEGFRVAAATGQPPAHMPFHFGGGAAAAAAAAGFVPASAVAAGAHRGKKRKAGRPVPTDPETNPQTARENQLLYALLTMGFTDKRQCLQIMRTCLEEETTEAPCTAEVVMLRLIRLREDLAEASQMDAARLESERLRKEEARLRRESLKAQEEEALRSADLQLWRSSPAYFVRSWLLANDTIRERLEYFMKYEDEGIEADEDPGTDVKERLLPLLKLEKKAQQWYGKILPSAYFVRLVGPRLLEASKGKWPNMADVLDAEVEKLELALYVLSEQTQGGVPRVFLDALNEYGDCNENTTATTTTGAATTDDGMDEDRPVVHVRSALRADGRTVVCID